MTPTERKAHQDALFHGQDMGKTETVLNNGWRMAVVGAWQSAAVCSWL